MENEEILDDSSVAEEQPSDTREIVEKALNEHETTQEKPEQAEPVQVEPEQPKHDPWKSWKKEAAEEMAKLPDNVQKYIIERQDQFHKGLEQYKAAANYAKTIDKSIAPYKEYLSQLGVTPEVAFPNLLKTERTLRTGSPQEKVEMFQKLAHDYGIDIGALANIPYDANLAQLKAQKEWLESQLQASQDFKQSHEDAQIQSVIEDFGSQHEFFDDVRMQMADLLDSGLATDLSDAYAKAIRLNDDVFAKAQAKQQANSKTAQLSKANQAAQAAKQSAVQVKGSPIGVKNQAAPKSTEDAVRMAFLAHGL